MNRRIVTEAALRQAKKEGVHAAELARRLGVSRVAVCNAQQMFNIKLPRPAPRHPDRDREIIRQREAGLSYRAIASQFSLSPTRVLDIVEGICGCP